MTLMNCTPHAVVIVAADGVPLAEFPPSGVCPRVSSQEIPMPPLEIGGIQIGTCRREYGAVTDMPSPQEGILYIVSSMVKAALPARPDLIVPHDFVRDDNGSIIGCRRFAR